LQSPQALGIASIAARDLLKETLDNTYGLPDITWIYEQAIGSFTLALHIIIWTPRTAHLMKENKRNIMARPEIEELTSETLSSTLTPKSNRSRTNNDSSDFFSPLSSALPDPVISSSISRRRWLRPETQYARWLNDLYTLYQIDTRSTPDLSSQSSVRLRTPSPQQLLDLTSIVRTFDESMKRKPSGAIEKAAKRVKTQLLYTPQNQPPLIAPPKKLPETHQQRPSKPPTEQKRKREQSILKKYKTSTSRT
jgi:hypothetical protein